GRLPCWGSQINLEYRIILVDLLCMGGQADFENPEKIAVWVRGFRSNCTCKFCWAHGLPLDVAECYYIYIVWMMNRRNFS
ncbi:hypothetical protein MKX03_023986, partial [Papaver bracteatum]